MKNKSILDFFPSLTKDFILAYRLAVIGIFAAGCLFIHLSINEEQQKIEDGLALSTEKIEKVITTDLDYIKYQIYYTAQQIKFVNADDKKIKTLLPAFANNLNNNQIDVSVTWNAFSWINKDGYLSIDGAAGRIFEPIDMSIRDYLKITKINPDRLIFGKTVESILSKRSIIPVGIGINSHRDNYLGTLVFGFDIERILAKIEKSIGDETISFVVLKDNNVAFSSNNFDYNLSKLNKLLTKVDKDDLEKKGQVISTQNIFSKKDSFIYTKTIKNYPLELVVIYDQKTSYQQILNLFLKQFLFIISIIFACVILFRQIYKKIVEPVYDLSKFAIKISERDFSFNLEKPAGRELIDLYNTLTLVKEALEKEEILLRQLELANQKISTENFNKSEFLAAISHDIRNPLAAISSFAHLIKDHDEASRQEVKEWSKDIENCAHEVLQFINDLMDVNQVASGEFSINLSSEIDLMDIVKRSIRVNRDFANRRNIAIESHLTFDLPKVKLDHRRMKQILVNLISNSIKYSKEDTKIEINLQKIFENNQEKVQITIKDHGFGMDTNQIKKAMEKYGKIENENSGKVDSFGLGLPLVKKLVEMQNGTMRIESVIGVGTSVILVFGNGIR
jgi:signal transduction histidine kinase